MAVAASAFTVDREPQKISFADPLWHFTGNSVEEQDEQEQYEPASSANPPNSTTGDLYCVIEAPEDVNYPAFPDLSNIQSSDT